MVADVRSGALDQMDYVRLAGHTIQNWPREELSAMYFLIWKASLGSQDQLSG